MRLTLSLFAALLVAACTLQPIGTDAQYSRVRTGMTPDEVRRITGAPHETMPFPLSGNNSWAWYYYDTFGYYALYSVTFGPDGRVVSTFSRRLNDGGDMR